MKKKNIGKYLARLRVASGYKSQRQLSQVSGISAATISRIESNIQIPQQNTLWRLAPYLKETSYMELLEACGYIVERDKIENQQYQFEELAILEELRSYPEFHKEILDNPKTLEKLYKLWSVLKREVF